MNARATTLLVGLLVSSGAGVFWWRSVDSPSEIPVTEVRAASRTVDYADADRGPVEAPPPTAPPAEAAVGRASVDDLTAQVAEIAYARGGGLFVQHLVTKGLSTADSERIVRRAIQDDARCFVDALVREAEAQSVSVSGVLDALEATLHDADGPLLGALLDEQSVAARYLPCVLDVLQQAGIEPAAAAEIVRERVRAR